MAAGDLVTLNQAEAWLGKNSDPNGIIAALISAVSSSIQQYISYQILTASYTKSFNGLGGYVQFLPDRPVTAISSVTVDGIVVPLRPTPTGDGYVFDKQAVYLTGCYQFNRGFQNVVVAYTAGYATVPADIQQACLNWLKAGYDQLARPGNASELRAGDTAIKYTFDVLMSDGRLLAPMPPSVYAALQPYNRVAPV